MAKKTVKKTVAKKAPAKAKELTAWDKVKIARDAKRPHIFDFIKATVELFTEHFVLFIVVTHTHIYRFFFTRKNIF